MQTTQLVRSCIFGALLLMLSPSVPAGNRSKDNESYGYSRSKNIKHVSTKKKLSNSEKDALSLLCKIGLNSTGSDAWVNNDVNAAIATLAWGRHWPEEAMTTAYKTCNFPNYGGRPKYPSFLKDIESTNLSVGQCVLANVASIDARLGAIDGEFGSENGKINLTNNYSLYLFRSLQDKNGVWKVHERSNPISLLDAKRMFKRNDPISLCLKSQPVVCRKRMNKTMGNIYSITNKRTKEKRYGQIGLISCGEN